MERGCLLVAVRLLFVGINAYRIYPVAMRCLHVDTRVRIARSLTLYRNFMHFGPDEYGFVAVAPHPGRRRFMRALRLTDRPSRSPENRGKMRGNG